MSQWINLINENELTNGQWKEFNIEGESILLIRQNNHYYAIQNLCTHDFGHLSDGSLEDDEIICPRHGARFCIKTGAVLCPPAYEDIGTFETRLFDNKVQVKIDD